MNMAPVLIGLKAGFGVCRTPFLRCSCECVNVFYICMQLTITIKSGSWISGSSFSRKASSILNRLSHGESKISSRSASFLISWYRKYHGATRQRRSSLSCFFHSTTSLTSAGTIIQTSFPYKSIGCITAFTIVSLLCPLRALQYSYWVRRRARPVLRFTWGRNRRPLSMVTYMP